MGCDQMIAKRRRKLVLMLLLVFLVTITSVISAEISEELKIITVQETDFVKIVPQAFDADGDEVIFTFSEPLNEKGEWETDYNDAGIYDVKITASDGVDKDIERVQLTVKNRNRIPIIKERKIVVKEKEQVNLKSIVEDPDDDPLAFVFKEPFNKNGEWLTDFDDQGSFVTTFTINDGEALVEARIEIIVLPTNQPPIIIDTFSEEGNVYIRENEELHFSVEAVDQDTDTVTYSWNVDGKIVSRERRGVYFFNYESAGEHELAVSISDGKKEINKRWIVEVENVNRRPALAILPVHAKEGKLIILNLPRKDIDGDILKYSYENPFNERGEWQTNYEDAGEHEIIVTFTDGEFIGEERVRINIIDVDREPALNIPEKIYAKEGEKSVWVLIGEDPDGDKISYSVKKSKETPRDLELKGNKLSWEPDFDTIKRGGGFFSNILNKLRLEHLFLKRRSIPITIIACGRELCSSKETSLTVYNINRAPSLESLNSVAVTETELAKLEVSAYDLDGDIVNYHFTKPLRKKEKNSGEWETSYEDEGLHAVWVTATDGNLGVTESTTIEVAKKNREPSIIIRDDDVVVNEGQEFLFRVGAEDPDGDAINLRLDNIPPGASFADGIFIWEPGYNMIEKRTDSWRNKFLNGHPYLNKKLSKDKATVWLSFAANDGDAEVVHPVKVVIKNVNQKPEILNFLPSGEITLSAGDVARFMVAAEDKDNDPLQYKWEFGLGQEDVSGTNVIERKYLAPGKKKVKVRVSDGWEEVEHEWIVNVARTEFVQPDPIVPGEDDSFRVYVIRS